MFISNAYADAAAPAAAAPGFDFNLMFFVGMIVVFYFLILRPQSKRAKEHKNMVAALQRGDEVVTTGGELGRISNVYEEYVGLEIAENVQVTVLKTAIQAVLPKGTIKAIK